MLNENVPPIMDRDPRWVPRPPDGLGAAKPHLPHANASYIGAHLVAPDRAAYPWPVNVLRRLWSRLAALVPFGLLVRGKPRHYREMLRVAWDNRGRWRYAWRILRHGVCDGCSLGPRGLRDDVLPGVHLCITRL